MIMCKLCGSERVILRMHHPNGVLELLLNSYRGPQADWSQIGAVFTQEFEPCPIHSWISQWFTHLFTLLVTVVNVKPPNLLWNPQFADQVFSPLNFIFTIALLLQAGEARPPDWCMPKVYRSLLIDRWGLAPTILGRHHHHRGNFLTLIWSSGEGPRLPLVISSRNCTLGAEKCTFPRLSLSEACALFLALFCVTLF